MILSYFDSSILLAILLDEERQEEAYSYWRNSIRVSSILLKIETIIGIRRTHEIYKHKLENDWLNKKTKIMDEYLNEVNYKVLNNKIEREIYLRKELAQRRSLDAIHIATALQFREINNNGEIYLYTFDKTMHSLAKRYKFKTNRMGY
jgi:predicted nucleic acid-binding protein